jgi:hypothetical protein
MYSILGRGFEGGQSSDGRMLVYGAFYYAYLP